MLAPIKVHSGRSRFEISPLDANVVRSSLVLTNRQGCKFG